MEHIRVATYEITNGSFQEVAAMAQEGMLKTFKGQPGFIRYGLADVGNKKCLSISMWNTREQAEGAVPVAATWVHENLGNRVELRSNMIGDLAFFKDAPVAV